MFLTLRNRLNVYIVIAKYIIGSLQVQSITSKDFEDHIEVLINENHLSVSSIKKTLDVINSAFEWAISQKILFENPCTPVMKKTPKTIIGFRNHRS